MQELRFEVRHPDGRSERFVVHAARAVVGSGAHCDVRLPPDQAAFEHVALELLPDATRCVRLAAAPVTLDGAALTIATVGASATLGIGQTILRVERVLEPEGARERSKLTFGVVTKGAVLALLACGLVLAAQRPEHGVGKAPAELPDLFGARALACSRSDRDEARAEALDTLAIADGARERSPFEPREAVVAVKAYDLAAACFRLAGDGEAGADAARSARELEEATVSELRARRVRLERMLAVKDYEVAEEDVAVLRAMLEGQRGPYVAWLAKIALELKNRTVRKG